MLNSLSNDENLNDCMEKTSGSFSSFLFYSLQKNYLTKEYFHNYTWKL